MSQVETATIGHFRYMGFSTGLSSVGPARRVVGTAVTLALPGSDSSILHHVLSEIRPGDILVIDRLGDDRYACWGGGVTKAAIAAGVAAAIMPSDAILADESGIVALRPEDVVTTAQEAILRQNRGPPDRRPCCAAEPPLRTIGKTTFCAGASLIEHS